MSESLIIVNEFKGIVQNMDAALFPILNRHLNFQTGNAKQVSESLAKAAGAITPESRARFPLVMIQQPFLEIFKDDFYCTVRFPKIAIADLSNGSDNVVKRYEQRFIPILYPIYEQFKIMIAQWPTVVLMNPDYLPHNKYDVPGDPPPDDKALVNGFNSYLDSIIITNLELSFQLNTSC